MLARFEGRQAESEVRVYRGCNGDRVDAGILEEILVTRGRPDSRIALAHNCKLFGIEVRNGDEIEARCLRKIANEVRPPISVSYNSDVNHSSAPFLYSKKIHSFEI